MSDPKWLQWARQVQAIAQAGLHYTDGAYDHERYEQLQALASEMLAAHLPQVQPGVLDEVLRSERGYLTPKIDVRGFVLNDRGEVLLIREKQDNGRWTLPGGWADVNVSPAENCIKEVLEESGYLTRTTRLLAFYDRQRHDHPPTLFHVYKAVFLCELTQPDPVPSPQGGLESDECGWFRADALPAAEALSTGRVTLAQLRRFFQMVGDGVQTTDYD
jgi:ADP-ribose pyrophosphatase YjhB (NUDIX family)